MINPMAISYMSKARRHVLEHSDDEEPCDKIHFEYMKNKAKYDEFNERCKHDRKKQRENKKEALILGNISSDDCTHNAAVFEFMKFSQRERHIKQLWWTTYKKAKAGSIMLLFLGNISKKI